MKNSFTPLDGGSIRRILVVKPSSLGDIIHLFPALELLKRYCPGATLDFVVNPEFAPLLDFSPFPVRRVIVFERRKLGKAKSMLPELLALRRKLRQEKYDLAIDFQGLLRSALCVKLSRAQVTVGFAKPREKAALLAYKIRVPLSATHAIDRQLEMVGKLFGSSLRIELPPAPKLSGVLPHPLPAKDLILLFPGARWASKSFPLPLFAEIVELVHKALPDYTFVISGNKSDAALALELIELLPNGFPLVDLTGRTTLREVFMLTSRCDAVISNDSGPLHIGAFMRKNCFSFYGPTDPERTGPWYESCRVYRNNDAPCLNCMLRRCPKKETLCHRIPAVTVAGDIIAALKNKKNSFGADGIAI